MFDLTEFLPCVSAFKAYLVSRVERQESFILRKRGEAVRFDAQRRQSSGRTFTWCPYHFLWPVGGYHVLVTHRGPCCTTVLLSPHSLRDSTRSKNTRVFRVTYVLELLSFFENQRILERDPSYETKRAIRTSIFVSFRSLSYFFFLFFSYSTTRQSDRFDAEIPESRRFANEVISKSQASVHFTNSTKLELVLVKEAQKAEERREKREKHERTRDVVFSTIEGLLRGKRHWCRDREYCCRESRTRLRVWRALANVS